MEEDNCFSVSSGTEKIEESVKGLKIKSTKRVVIIGVAMINMM